MGADLLDGKQASKEIRDNIAERVSKFKQQGQRPPGLAVIMVGSDPASAIYVRNKRTACEQAGIKSIAHDLPSTTTTAELIKIIEELNQDLSIDGILVQLPLPNHIDSNLVMETIIPTKDVDGFHPYNFGRLALRRPTLSPCTPVGIVELLNRTGQSVRGMDATIVGVSNIVGRPMVLELMLLGCTVTSCHRFTRHLQKKVEQADLLVVAVGRPALIKGDWIKPGAIVIDVGMNRTEDGRLVGDVEFDVAKERAAWITPVPGGVGPMTIACLLKNTLQAYENLNQTK